MDPKMLEKIAALPAEKQAALRKTLEGLGLVQPEGEAKPAEKVETPAAAAETEELKKTVASLTERLKKVEGMPAADKTAGAAEARAREGKEEETEAGHVERLLKFQRGGGGEHKEDDALGALLKVHSAGGSPVTPGMQPSFLSVAV